MQIQCIENFVPMLRLIHFSWDGFVAKWNQNVLAYYFTPLYFCKKVNSVLDSAEGSKDNMVWNRRYEYSRKEKSALDVSLQNSLFSSVQQKHKAVKKIYKGTIMRGITV